MLGLGANIKADIPVKSWQKHTQWTTGKMPWEAAGYSSEDEMAAVCMGVYWTGVRVS